MRITSRKNPQLLHIKKLLEKPGYSRQQGQFVAEGEKLLSSALQAKFPITELVCCEDTVLPPEVEHIPQITVPEDVMAWLSPMKSPQGVLFLGEIPQRELGDLRGNYLVLDAVQDPGNVGTLWRTAQGLGASGLILLEGCANPWSAKCIRAGMGAVFHLPVYEMTEETLLESLGDYPLYGTALNPDSASLGTVALENCAVVLGNEGQGVSPSLLAHCEKTLYLPMEQGCESLNVAMMGGILLWEMAKCSSAPGERTVR